MPSRNGRWYWLTVLALCNLVLWVVVAALVGLLVSDEVDLGFETELRQVQATAVAAWRRLLERELVLPDRSTPSASSLRPTATPLATRQATPMSGAVQTKAAAAPAASSVSGPSAAEELAAAQMPPASPTPAGPQPGGAVPPESRPATPAAAQSSSAAMGQGAIQSANRGRPEPTSALLSQPLLLTDPEFHNLAKLNAEMARSAPGRVVQIRYQEATLSREIQTLCENKPDLGLRNVRADLQRDRVVLVGEITVLGFRVEAKVTGSVIARDCRPEMEIQTIAVGGVLVPQFVWDRIEQQVWEAMAWYPADYPLCLEQIVLEDRGATIYGYCR